MTASMEPTEREVLDITSRTPKATSQWRVLRGEKTPGTKRNKFIISQEYLDWFAKQDIEPEIPTVFPRPDVPNSIEKHLATLDNRKQHWFMRLQALAGINKYVRSANGSDIDIVRTFARHFVRAIVNNKLNVSKPQLVAEINSCLSVLCIKARWDLTPYAAELIRFEESNKNENVKKNILQNIPFTRKEAEKVALSKLCSGNLIFAELVLLCIAESIRDLPLKYESIYQSALYPIAAATVIEMGDKARGTITLWGRDINDYTEDPINVIYTKMDELVREGKMEPLDGYLENSYSIDDAQEEHKEDNNNEKKSRE